MKRSDSTGYRYSFGNIGWFGKFGKNYSVFSYSICNKQV